MKAPDGLIFFQENYFRISQFKVEIHWLTQVVFSKDLN